MHKAQTISVKKLFFPQLVFPSLKSLASLSALPTALVNPPRLENINLYPTIPSTDIPVRGSYGGVECQEKNDGTTIGEAGGRRESISDSRPDSICPTSLSQVLRRRPTRIFKLTTQVRKVRLSGKK